MADDPNARSKGQVPDVIAEGLAVLFCGINPGRSSGASGHHFAGPGNRFWKVLAGSGFTPTVFEPGMDSELLSLGIGITNLVSRVTATAAELSREELRAGAVRLAATSRTYMPRIVAILGLGAYRTAFLSSRAGIGEQSEGLAGARLWVLPNPSGLQAHYQLPELEVLFRELKTAADSD